ncbi:MAG: hypothetical protein H6868_09605 [Rhodospirillales bacterium]|nr:hypothetical protein [Rhodospirillales bacterium]
MSEKKRPSGQSAFREAAGKIGNVLAPIVLVVGGGLLGQPLHDFFGKLAGNNADETQPPTSEIIPDFLNIGKIDRLPHTSAARSGNLVKNGKVRLPGFTTGLGPHRDTFAVSSAVQKAVAKAARTTGNSEEFLYRVYARESGLTPDSCNNVNGPCGLAQFQPETFLEFAYKYKGQLPKEHKKLYDQIKYGKSTHWKYTVTNPKTKAALLELRNDPEVAAILGGFHMNENFARVKKALPKAIARQLDDTDKYIGGHFLSVGGGSKFLKLLHNPKTAHHAAKDYLPEQAKSNEAIFYYTNSKGAQKPCSFKQIHQNIARQIEPPTQSIDMQVAQQIEPQRPG